MISSITIPDPVLGAAAVAFFGAATLVTRSMVNTVREAARTVTANGAFKETIAALEATNAAQQQCISTLEEQVTRLQKEVDELMTQNARQTERIGELERTLGAIEIVQKLRKNTEP
jgi:uncharacterized coiled-coil protein SlyX